MAPDPRPWQAEALPIAEFASFSNEVMPQTYWPMFDNSANYRLYRERGFDVSGGVTPEFVVDNTKAVFGQYGLPIKPVGTGNSDMRSWERFVGRAHEHFMSAVSVWRFGTARDEIWDVFARAKPQYNEYYGPDWKKPEAPVVVAPTAPQPDANAIAQSPNRLPTLPAANDPEGVRVQAAAAKEATSSEQGVTRDLDLITKSNPFSNRSPAKSAPKSFWADPISKALGR
jgi:hypothetical protein